ncbi:hypothetical protein F5Y13DRAFT_165750 [Hypoxylon sp. FL1857]|nr:hypothetical protein F5Y13DRAFT_165750 [Hypoxylon sp. FL1857]
MSSVKISENEFDVPMYFLNRIKLWDKVKPYNFQYYPKEDFPRHNLDHSPRLTRVKSMRSYDPPASLDVQGFGIHRLKTSMEYLDFIDEATIENVYCKELEKYFKEVLGAKHVRALDFQVRRRDMEFPYFGGKLPPRPQPSLMTHVDVTPAAAESIVRDLYEDVADQILQSRYQIITAWRPFQVPVQDWPLAICDATTVDEGDLVATDIIYPNYVAENRMVHFNENQKWYWLPDQTEDEILVFKAVDTGSPTGWPCPHGAFPLLGQETDGPSRESIDVRLLVMYADIDYPESKGQARVY